MNTSKTKRIGLALTIFSFLFVTIAGLATPNKARAGSVCSPATPISVPYSKNGVGDVCLQATSLCEYINSWGQTTIEVNGTTYVGWISGSSIPPLNGGYTIHYVSPDASGHFEISGSTCAPAPTATSGAAVPTFTRTATLAASATATLTRTAAAATQIATQTATQTATRTLTATSTATLINTQAPLQNPVHLYTFDGNANDTGSGSAANGTVSGGTYDTGRIGQSTSLNGSSQYVSFPNGFVNNLSDFSIATWVYLNSSSNWTRLFDFGTGTSAYMFLVPQNGTSNVVRFSIKNAGGGEQQINGSAALPTGVWTHVAVTKSGNTGTLYVNGAVVGTNTNMTLGPSSLGNTTQNWIGRSQFSADPYLNGRVDDFRIYNRALSGSEVSSLGSSGSNPTLVPPQQIPAGVVSMYGRLQISGAALRDKNGTAIQLAGISSHGLTWFPLSDLNLNNASNISLMNQEIVFNPAGGVKFPYTSSAVKNLVTQMNMQVTRASMFTYDPWNGVDAKSYDNNYPNWKWYNINLVNTIVQSAIDQNIYVIIDWHAGEGNDPNPNPYWTNGHVQEFFTYMVDKWGSYPNVIYETVNSPNSVDWYNGSGNDLKTFNQNVVNHIRAREAAKGYAPNVILVGTPTFSQDVDTATYSPLTGNLIAYNFMWYAGTHGSWIRAKADTALNTLAANTPHQTLFMGEIGTTASNGNGGVYYNDFNTWMEWAKTKKLSWLLWSISNKEESSAIFVPSILGNINNNETAWRGGNGGSIPQALSSTGNPMRMGPWADADYTCNGKFIKGWLFYNTSQPVPPGC